MDTKNPAPSIAGAECKTLGELWNSKGYTYVSIAGVLGVDPLIVSGWEESDGMPNAGQCLMLADILQCDLKDIYIAILNS